MWVNVFRFKLKNGGKICNISAALNIPGNTRLILCISREPGVLQLYSRQLQWYEVIVIMG